MKKYCPKCCNDDLTIYKTVGGWYEPPEHQYICRHCGSLTWEEDLVYEVYMSENIIEVDLDFLDDKEEKYEN